MKKLRKTLIPATLSVLTAVTLTGCFPTGEVSDPAPSQTAPATSTAPTSGDASAPSDTSAPANTVLTVGDKVTIDVTPPASYPSEVPIIKCHLRDFRAESEDMKKLFLDGKEIDREESSANLTNYITTDGGVLTVNYTGNLTYEPQAPLYIDDEDKQFVIGIQKTCAENLIKTENYFPHMDDELDGFPRSDAVKRAGEFVDKLNIINLSAPEVYAITVEDVQNFPVEMFSGKEETLDSDTQLPFDKDDECYLVLYRFVYKDIPISTDSDSLHVGYGNVGGYVRVVLTKDELVGIQCYDIFDSIEETGETVQVKCSPETAITKLYDYFNIQEYSLTSYFDFKGEINLNYGLNCDPVGKEYIYKPCWAIAGTSRHGDNENLWIKWAYIDLFTGMVSDLNH